jgi:hypothetical protein
MAVNTANVLVGQAALYTAPVGTIYPLDTLAPGVPWLTPWVHVGATEEGVGFAVGSDTADIRIEEQATPVMVVMNSRNIRVIVSLSEDTVETMKLAYGGGTIVTQAAGVGVIGKKTLTLSDELETLAAGFEGRSPAGLFRRVIIPRIISVADVTTTYRRATNNRAYSIELRAICAASEIRVCDQTAVAT